MKTAVVALTDDVITQTNGGGKAANLQKLKKLGYSVPNGFVILVGVFEHMLSIALEGTSDFHSKLLDAAGSPNSPECAHFCEEMRVLIQNSPVPTETEQNIKCFLDKLSKKGLLAVRSSATAEDSIHSSWAGQFLTILRVRNSYGDVISSIRKVWASIYTPRVFSYASHVGITIDGLKMAVIVQELIESPDFSGVVFTQHPNGDNDRLYIEVVKGYGETLVSGKINPDSYVLSKSSKQSEAKGSLPLAVLYKLRDLTISIENALKGPQDIEWTLKSGIIYLLQSRPISVPTVKCARTIERKGKRILTKGLPASSGHGSGKAKLVFNINDASLVEKGDIIVAPMTNPDMVPFMIRAAGIVTDVGGMICHTAIVAREMQIPCVVGAGNATFIIQQGTLVTVDGDTGTVFEGMYLPSKHPTIKELVSLIADKVKSIRELKDKSDDSSSQSFGTAVYSALDTITFDYFTVLESTSRFFGHEPEVIRMKYPYPPRMGPWWPENWQYPWIFPEEEDSLWGNVRPEIVNTPLTKSLIVQGVESIPFVFQMEELGPLYTRWRKCRIHIPVERVDKIRMALANRLSNDKEYFQAYIDDLHNIYEEWDAATSKIRTRLETRSNLAIQDLMDMFKFLWRIHERFFALCFLIQTLGDDVVWPSISRINLLICKNLGLVNPDIAASHITRLLASPPYQTLSSKYLDSLTSLFKLQQDLSQNSIDRGQTEWVSAIDDHIGKWGWMRDRDLLYRPLNTRRAVEEILRGFSEARPPKIERVEWEKALKTIASALETKELKKRYIHLVHLGVRLHLEREDHHVIWVRNVDTMRTIVIHFAKHLKKIGFLRQEEDIFFLQIPEIFSLFQNPSVEDQIVTKLIPNRKLAFQIESRDSEIPNSEVTAEGEEDYY